MTSGDITGLILSYVYAFGMLFGVEALGRALKWGQPFTRKIIHIGAGLWVWGILYFFDHWYFGIIPFATFIVLNYIFYRQQAFKTMDAEDSTLGTVYFAISITVLFAGLWRTEGQPDRVSIAVAAVMAMTLGDAMASIVGRKWGTHKYTVFGHTRSFEGTWAMLIFSLVGVIAGLILVPALGLSPNAVMPTSTQMVIMIGAATAIATLAEAMSPAGLDNLSVPLLSGLALWLLSLGM